MLNAVPTPLIVALPVVAVIVPVPAVNQISGLLQLPVATDVTVAAFEFMLEHNNRINSHRLSNLVDIG